MQISWDLCRQTEGEMTAVVAEAVPLCCWVLAVDVSTCAACAGLQQIVFNFEKTKDSLSGPVAIVAVGAEVARSDISGLFQFAAILNINLAVINILPLPVSPSSFLVLKLQQFRGCIVQRVTVSMCIKPCQEHAPPRR